jgi:8-oxo-dGTP pyrophosphatase MutT (NUDIX family)
LQSLNIVYSGAIPFRIQAGRIEVCLITSRKRGRWIIPKGRIGHNSDPRTATARECFEEAGLNGALSHQPCGAFRKKQQWINVYVLEVSHEHNSWPEQDERQREWMSVNEALARISNPGLRSIVRHLRAYASADRSFVEVPEALSEGPASAA